MQRLIRLWSSIVPCVNYSQLMHPSDYSVQQSFAQGGYRYLTMKEGGGLTVDYLKSEKAQHLVKLTIEMREEIEDLRKSGKLTDKL